MVSYIFNRLSYIIIVLILLSAIIFSVTHLLPGSAANLILGEYATAEKIQKLEKKLGLDKPFYLQYWNWIKHIPSGDWGQSMIMKKPVTAIIKLRLKNSAYLAAIAMILVIFVGIPLGALAAIRHKTKLDLIIVAGSYVGISVPEFVTGTLLIVVLAGPAVGIFPTGGYQEFSAGMIGWFSHLLLPAMTLTLILLAHVVRQTRSGMISVLKSDYVRTARLKGASEMRVIVKHALKNGLLPTITVLAMDLGYLMGSIVIVEEVFAYPGMGRLIIYSVQNRDIPVLQMTVLTVGLVYTVSNFIADLLYAYLDPRIRYR